MSQRGGRRKSLCQHLSRPATASVCPFRCAANHFTYPGRSARAELIGCVRHLPRPTNEFSSCGTRLRPARHLLWRPMAGSNLHMLTLRLCPAQSNALPPGPAPPPEADGGNEFYTCQIRLRLFECASHSEIPGTLPLKFDLGSESRFPMLRSFRHCCFGSTGLTI